jgi:hypothetical protein
MNGRSLCCSNPYVVFFIFTSVAVHICLSELFDSFDLDMDANPFPLEDRPVRSRHFTSHLHSPCGMVTKGTLVSR